VIQGDSFNRSRIATVVCVALSSNVAQAGVPGNVLLKAKATGLSKDSVALASQLLTLDRGALSACAGRLPPAALVEVLAGVQLVLGL
jgi:mRNA interferase MazF